MAHPWIIVLFTVESYVKSLGRPDLFDLLVVNPASEDVIMQEVEDLRPSKRKVIYSEVFMYYLPGHAFFSF